MLIVDTNKQVWSAFKVVQTIFVCHYSLKGPILAQKFSLGSKKRVMVYNTHPIFFLHF